MLKLTIETLERGVKYVQICSKVMIKTPKRRQWRRSGSLFIANFEHISHFFLMFLLLTLNRLNADWVRAAFFSNTEKYPTVNYIVKLNTVKH